VQSSPQSSQYKGIPMLVLSGELDFSMRTELEGALNRLFEAGVCLILDLRDVTFIDSAALGLIISLHSSVRERGAGALAIIGRPESNVGRVFEATRLVGILHLFGELDEAAEYLDKVCEP
jgi:anti-anti-sigma factor